MRSVWREMCHGRFHILSVRTEERNVNQDESCELLFREDKIRDVPVMVSFHRERTCVPQRAV